ncbi:MAG: DUF1565 domain-containing protein, partial [Deltaproteobacteria bacterium]|nr:DUF1565 domain-containing protein [Deltaproteobacteria bacterium]
MSSRGSTAALIAAFLLAGACHDTATGSLEACNHKDDDWDGRTDEEFRDRDGRYHTLEHCGDCGIDCAAVFPSAAEVGCEAGEGGFRCEIISCTVGTHLVGTSHCAADSSALCLPCVEDDDCAIADPGAACLTFEAGERRCGPACDATDACDPGFDCEGDDGDSHCRPTSGRCGCTPDQEGLSFGCWIESPGGDHACHGTAICDGLELGDCELNHSDICDGLDNDCDGETDEEFIVDGFYLTEEHCGACNHPCAPLAPHTVSSCVRDGDGTACLRECESGFVDLDGAALNGCECMRADSEWPPIALGGDMNCDGSVDPTDDFVFVSRSGADANPGTLEEPVRTIGRGIEIATPASKTVLVAQGSYDEQVVLEDGVSVYGGYRSDFAARDIALMEVIVEHVSGPPGHPVLVAEGIQAATEVTGMVLVGSDAMEAGAGSTTVLLSLSSSGLGLRDLKVVAGLGASGRSGRSSTVIMDKDLGGIKPAQLDGTKGKDGEDGISVGSASCFGLRGDGGGAGSKVCPITDESVSGGRGGDASCPNTGCAVGLPCPNSGCSDFTSSSGECDFDAIYAAAVPNPPAEDGSGEGAGEAGELTYDAATTRMGSNFCDDNPTLRREGDNGGAGRSGDDGERGDGCDEAASGFDVETGLWSAGDGTGGRRGDDGAGGGGGTQGNGYDALAGASGIFDDHIGGAGGGGGSGGCGAVGAEGGAGGGGSIGVAIIVPPSGIGPFIDNVRIIPARGGDGGNGGIGAAGGTAGSGGQGGDGNFWCARRGGKGGDGGRGGDGGGGGGGCGGSTSGFHVVPVGFVDLSPYVAEITGANTVDAMPSAGSAGKGGFSPGQTGHNGAAGSAKAFRL